MKIAWFQLVPFLLLFAFPCSPQTVAGVPTSGDSPGASEFDQIRLSEIVISTPQPYDPAQVAEAERKAEMAREAIRQGAKFEDIARKYSDASSAVNGGARPVFIQRGQLAKQIEDKTFAMNVGDVSDVIRTKQGFVILKVTVHLVAADAHECKDSLDILSDTQGVSFGSYVQRVCQEVSANWHQLIPDSAMLKKGLLAIEFAIMKNGEVADMRLVATSGDVALDRPAWGSITASNPFPPLPSDFTGPYLALRFHFYYHPEKSDLNTPPKSALAIRNRCSGASFCKILITTVEDPTNTHC